MSESPIYDSLLGEWGHVPGTFSHDELAILLEARRLCGVPERPALMPVQDSLAARLRTQGLVPVHTLRERAAVEQDTVETDIRTLAHA
jgi:hypothetical protein